MAQKNLRTTEHNSNILSENNFLSHSPLCFAYFKVFGFYFFRFYPLHIRFWHKNNAYNGFFSVCLMKTGCLATMKDLFCVVNGDYRQKNDQIQHIKGFRIEIIPPKDLALTWYERTSATFSVCLSGKNALEGYFVILG